MFKKRAEIMWQSKRGRKKGSKKEREKFLKKYDKKKKIVKREGSNLERKKCECLFVRHTDRDNARRQR